MSKKNSSVNLKTGFKNSSDLFNVFLNFKKKLDFLNKKKYLVAVSGGSDSLALVALTKAYTFQKKTKFFYVLVNHNIRKNSDIEAQQVKRLLRKKNIILRILSNKEKISKNIQAEARKVRYSMMKNYCIKNKIKVLLTAHNLEDQVETFFIRLSRGSGLKGLSSMMPLSKINNQISLYRPLLDTKKIFLTKISKNVFGKYFKDPSNNNIKYLRTKIRNLKGPLEKSGVKYDQIFKSIQNLSSSNNTLNDYLRKTLKKLIKKNNREVLINFKDFNKLDIDAKMALINESVKRIKKNYYDLRSKKVNNLIENLNKAGFKKATLGGCIFYKKGENICIKVENMNI